MTEGRVSGQVAATTHKKIETTLKYYVVTPEEFEHEAIKRLYGRDTCTDTCKNEGAEHDAQPLDLFGGAEGDRTPDLLTASYPPSLLIGFGPI